MSQMAGNENALGASAGESVNTSSRITRSITNIAILAHTPAAQA